MKKIVGIIIAKKNSNRFPNKNIYEYEGYPLFWHNVMRLIESKYDIEIVVATDSEYIENYCQENSINVIRRGPNIIDDNQPLFDVLKYAYNTLNLRYDICVNILANTINVRSKDIDNSIHLLVDNQLKEVRSYNQKGVENGLLVLDTDIITTKYQISTYVGSIITKSKEIHFKHEL